MPRDARSRAADYRRDALTATVLAVGAWLSSLLYLGAVDQPHAPPWGTAIWAAVIAGSLAFRRRFPEPVALVVAATFVIGQYSGVYEQLFANICLFLALYSVGAWGRNRMLATAVRILIAAGMVLWLVGVLAFQAMNPGSGPDVSRDGLFSQFTAIGLISLVTNLLYFGAAYVFGDAAYRAAREHEALVERTVELEREREVSSRQAVALERVRIAQELHDVVAHHVSVMGLQAGAARRILNRSTGAAPDPRVTEALGVIESNGREAVDELHRMLGALRQPDDGPETAGDGPASRSTSTRSVDQLPELVEETRAGGVPVEVSVVGSPRALPPSIGLAVYRIAQESLTNVRKHAGPRATVDLRLRYLDDGVELEVSDSGVGAASGTGAASGGLFSSSAPRPTASGGLGLIGMRERVAAVGGELENGPRSRGGYRVRAWLPLAPRDASGAAVDGAGS